MPGIIIDPTTLVELERGTTRFKRPRYMAFGQSRITEWKVPGVKDGTAEEANYVFGELDMAPGRHIGLCNRLTDGALGCAEKEEDPDRKGFAHPKCFRKLKKQQCEHVPDNLRKHFGDNMDYIFHELPHPHAYPTYMGCGGNDPPNPKFFPLPNEDGTYDHVAEFIHEAFKIYFNDFTWPKYFEPLNEPVAKQMKHDEFSEFYIGLYASLRNRGISKEKMMIGGPCLWGMAIYREMFNRPVWKQLRRFYELALPTIDFYSFHLYDKGHARITGPSYTLDGLLDLNENMAFNYAGGFRPYATSEYGGGEGSDMDVFDMDKRLKAIYFHMLAMARILVTLVRRPYSVLKAVPYILDCADYKPVHYAGAYVREDFDKKKKFIRGPLFTYIEMWRDLRGHYVDILNESDYPDVSCFALLEEREGGIAILRFVIANLSNANAQQIPFGLAKNAKISQWRLRRLYQNERGHMARQEMEIPVDTAGQSFVASLQPGEVQYHLMWLDVYECSRKLLYNRFYGAETEQKTNKQGHAQIHVALPQSAVDRFERAELSVFYAVPGKHHPTPKDVSINNSSLRWAQGEDRPARETHDMNLRCRKFPVPKGVLKAQNKVELHLREGNGLFMSAIVSTWEAA
eukprot:CAMPEP_0198726062 /NCGR_PEP_ID=MMETSP1475-20131203/3229_1 /TAXON_ID= ORGANISM="Unidentified sp., Strain CCMP1999" /NCGR_SAMPLE_ID=MMETSP1475 /ASSEMBLY_ACC=CAM_ASM_001111 /LENGTH=627 /DNA_ID=CAMNT_0044487943 /DNA_START=88 /DNA_END=1971 /DNA_ORIENTATION=-